MASKKGYYIDIEKGTVESAEEHDTKVKVKEIREIKSLFADWFGYNYQNTGFYRLLKEKEVKEQNNAK